jgi:hypothetical protein
MNKELNSIRDLAKAYLGAYEGLEIALCGLPFSFEIYCLS